MAGVNSRARSILIKKQLVLGAAQTLIAADGIGDFSDLGFAKPDLKRINTDNLAQQTFGHSKSRYDSGAATIAGNVVVPVYRATTPGSVPGNGIDAILEAVCGLLKTVNAGVSVVYTPQTPAALIDAPRATVEIVEGSNAYAFVDTRGSAVLTGAPGADLSIKTDFKAPFVEPTPNASPITVAGPAGQPMRFTGAVVFLKNAAPINIGSIEFDIGGEVVESLHSGGSDVLVKNRKPMLKIPTNSVVGALNHAAIRNATVFTMQATWAGLVLDITARLSDLAPEDQDGTHGNQESFEVLTYALKFI